MAKTPVEVTKSALAPAPASRPDPWGSLRSEMDRLFDRFSGAFGFPAMRRVFDIEPAWRSEFTFAAPVVDLSEDDKGYRVTAELPGIEEKDLDVSVSGDMLVIKGEKRQEREHKDKNYHVSERSYGSFQRAFVLPEDINRDKISADLSKGVLTVTLPKTAEAAKPAKKIEVKAAA